MGCFDTIIDKIICPKCGVLIEEGLQTKDLDCELNVYTLEEVAIKYPNVHTISVFNACNNCKPAREPEALYDYDSFHFDIDIDKIRQKIKKSECKANLNISKEIRDAHHVYQEDDAARKVHDAVLEKLGSMWKENDNAVYSCTELESKKLIAFKDKHRHNRGSMVWVSFHGTGIGNVVNVRCDICGDEEDITDINSW